MDSLPHLEPEYADILTMPARVSPEATVAEAIALMTPAQAISTQGDGTACLLVVENERLIGLFTGQNLICCANAEAIFSQTTVCQWMTSPLITLTPQQLNDGKRLITLLRQNQYLPIVDDCQRPLGIMSETGLLRLLDTAKLAEHLQQSLSLAVPPQAHQLSEADELQPIQAAGDLPDPTSLRQYAQIVFDSPARICIIDRNGIYQTANRAYLEWQKQSVKTLKGCSASEVLGAEYFNCSVKSRLNRCLAGETIHDEEWVTVGIHPEFISITYSPYFEADGQISAAIITVRDISQLKRAERAEGQLRQREAFLRNIFDSVTEVIWVAERLEDDEYWIVSANEAVQSILGISTLDWIGRRLEELWAPETAEIMRSRYRACLEHGQPVTWEGPIRTATGSKWMLTTLSRLDDCQGKPRVLGVSADISDRKQAEESLRRLEELHRSTLEALPDLIIRMKSDGTYLDVKSATESPMIPVMTGNTVWEALPPKLARHRLFLTEQALQTREIQVYEYSLRIQQNSRRQEARIVPLKADDEVLVIIRDVTDRYLAEMERQQALKELRLLNQELEHRVAQRTQELRESEQRFRTIFEQAAVGIAQADMSGRFLQANQRFCDLVGYSPDELYQKKYRHLTPSEHLPQDDRLMASLLAGEIKSFSLEKQYLRKGGALQWINLTVSLMRDQEGRPQYNIGIIEDISDRKAAEAALRESEERFRAIFEQAAVGISQTDLSGRYIQVNQTFCQLLGYSETDLLGQPWQNFIHPDDLTKDQSLVQRIFEGEITSFSTEKRYLRRDGQTLWTQKTLSVMRNESNAVTCVVAVIEDISDRKRAEQALQESQQQLASIADNIPGNIFREVFHADGRITLSFMSQGEKELSGIDPEKIQYDRDRLLASVHPADRSEFERQLIASAKALQPFDYAYRVVHTSGEIRWAKENIRFFQLDNGDIIGDGITLDITQQKRAEAEVRRALAQEKELNQLKSRFISTTSHEFRTPLAVIASSAGILQDFANKLSDERKQQHLKTIQTYIKHVTRLLDDVLLMNRAETGRLAFQPSPLRLVEFCQGLIAELQPSMPEHELLFQVCQQPAIAAENFEAEIKADPELLRRIFCNLLSNAAKYSEPGSPIDFILAVQANWVQVEICDRGIGIPLEDQPQLFEAFHRAQNVGNIAGTGLGLSIVKQCLDLHGGQISFESALVQVT
ncbi:MAG: PAS domain S-box protein, partial [Leptolyngbya sp. SIO4C5]|nr:PAS domain S-box protein [Leptolyngbya sp. SIO4C5]